MKRREFITLLGGAAAAWPLAARAQQPAKLPTIGFLGAATPSIWNLFVAAFVQRLRELGWIEGRTIAIEYRWAEGRGERFAEIAAEFVRLKVDVIVTSGGAVLAAKQATSLIPIVFAVATDPVGGGLVASLARPGGNVTGLSMSVYRSCRQATRTLARDRARSSPVGDHGNVGYPAAVLEMGEVQAAARTLSLEVATLEIRRAEDIAPAFATLKGRAEALYRLCRAAGSHQQGSYQHVGARRAIADDVWPSGARGSGRSDVIWGALSRPVAARRRPRRQNSARSEARRHPSRAADQIRSGDQPQDRESARPRHSAALLARADEVIE